MGAQVQTTQDVKVVKGDVFLNGELIGYVGKYDSTGVSDIEGKGWMLRALDMQEAELGYKTRKSAVDALVMWAQL